MKYKDASAVESVCWNMRLTDLPRSTNRSLIQDLANGAPPYSEETAREQNIDVNCNFLDLTNIVQTARGQCETAFFSPAQYFTVKMNHGPAHRRDEYGEKITNALRRAMKNGHFALKYREQLRNVFSSVVVYGPGPVNWSDNYSWCPEMQAVADVLVPSDTLISMENLSHFSVYRRYTAAQLYRKISGPKVDKAWNKEVAEACIKWAMEQYGQTTAAVDWTWNPERWSEDIKENGGVYNSDAVPTINCWDFYYLDDESKQHGWKRKIILDSPSLSESSRGGLKGAKNFLGKQNQFLYNSGERNYADSLHQIMHWQFGDGSIIPPFRYHSIRSLGWLLFAVCQFQNRLRCALTSAAFEACLQYFRAINQTDAQKVLSLNLHNRGVIPEGVNFVGAQERWKTDVNLVQAVMSLNRQSIADNSTQYTRNFGYGESETVEKTATQISAEVNAASALVGSILESAYGYQYFQYREICRRFCRPNSKDPDVRQFRLDCLRDGVPVEMLNVHFWDISPEKVLGNGARALAIAQAREIMSVYHQLDPSAQRIAMRSFIFAITNDPAKTDLLAPPAPSKVTAAQHDAELASARLLDGLPMQFVEGYSHAEYAAVLLGTMQAVIGKISQRGMATPDEIAGLQNLAGQTIEGQPIPGNGAMPHIQKLSEDKGAKAVVKTLTDTLGQMMNQTKALAQQLQEAQQAQASQNGNGDIPPEQMAKIQIEAAKGQQKLQNMRESHQQRAQQKAEIHAQQMAEQQQRSQLENANAIRRTEVDESIADLKAAGEINRQTPLA